MLQGEKRGNGERTLSGEEGNGGTLGTGTTSTADTVDIVLRVVGVVVVQHVSDITNVFYKGFVSINRVLVGKATWP